MISYHLKGGLGMNIKDFFKVWNKDIKSISVIEYNGVVELLINGHYIISLQVKNYSKITPNWKK